jgi:chromosome segregation ATPase
VNANSFAEQRRQLLDAMQDKTKAEGRLDEIQAQHVLLVSDHEALSKENSRLHKELARLQKQVRTLTNDYSAIVSEKSDLERRLGETEQSNETVLTNLQDADSQLEQILTFSNVSTPKQLIKHITSQHSAIRRYQKKLIIAKKEIASATERLVNFEKVTKAQSDDIELRKGQVVELTQIQAELHAECTKLSATVERLRRRDRVGIAILPAVVSIQHRMGIIRAALSLTHGDSGISLRSLIIVAIIARRWKASIGSNHELNPSWNSWAWLSVKSDSDILDAIAVIRKDSVTKEKEMKALRAGIMEKDEAIVHLSANVDHLSTKTNEQELRIGELERVLENQNETLSEKIDPTSYQSLVGRCSKAKQELKEARMALQQRAHQIENLEHEKSDATSIANEYSEKTEKAEAALEAALRNLAIQRSENELLSHQLRARNRDLFALERMMRGCAEQAKVRKSQMASFAAETQSRKQHSKPPKTRKADLSVLLQEMAQNLSGTLCD